MEETKIVEKKENAEKEKKLNRLQKAYWSVLDNVIMNLVQGQEEYYTSMRKVYLLFMRSLCLLVIFGFISRIDSITNPYYLRVQNIIVMILIILMGISIFSMKRIKNTIKKAYEDEKKSKQKEY